MLRIEIWMVPLGNEAQKRLLGQLKIVNDGTGTHERGNYTLALATGRRIWRKGVITNYDRITRPIWDIVHTSLDVLKVRGMLS
jgi:hypothetical protein